MMKKTFCMLLALVLCAACFGVSASEEDQTMDMPEAGMKFILPVEFDTAKGVVATDGLSPLPADGSYFVYFYYAAATREEYEKLVAENPDGLQSRLSLLFYVFALGGGEDFSTIEAMTGGSLTAAGATEIGRLGSYTYYLYMTPDPGFAASLSAEYREDYEALCGMKDKIAAGFTFYQPVNPYSALEGTVISFEATDLDGKPVSSAELFAKHEVTMVNIWATWCGPCVGELPELQAIHTRILGKDCAIVGLLTDDNVEEARRLIQENGLTYDIILVPQSFRNIFPYEAVPTTFFVDREGRYLGKTIIGAQPDAYEKAIESFLKETAPADK